MSVSDAFGDLIVDAPLPVLPAVADDDFGDLQEAPGPVDDVEEFGDFEGDSTIPDGEISEPLQSGSHPAPMQGTTVDDDDFGDFSGIPAMGAIHDTRGIAHYESTELGPTDTAVSSMEYSQPDQDGPLPSLDVPGAMDDFGDFVSTTVESTFTEMESSPLNDTPAAYELSRFQTPLTLGSNGFDEITSADPRSSAFDEIQPIHNQSLPPLADAQPDDSFGEFNGISELRADVPEHSQFSSALDGIQSVQDQAQNLVAQGDDGGFEGAGHVLNEGALSSAFDELQTMNDQPLPALQSLVTSRQEDDSDDFGEFEGTPTVIDHDEIATDIRVHGIQLNQDRSSSPAIHPLAADDDFGDFEGTPDNTQPDVSTLDDPFSSAFDSIQPIYDQPLPPLHYGLPPSRDMDDFGNFEGVTDNMKDVTSVLDTLSGAVGGMQPIQDQPTSPNTAPPQPENEHDNNEFEIFGGVTNVENTARTSIDNPFLSVFDDIQPIQNHPLKSLQSWSAPAKADDASDDDGFGNFSGVAVATNVTTTVAETQILGPFGHIQPIQDQPLQSGTCTLEDDDDDFGDFVGTSCDVAPSDSTPTEFGVAQPTPMSHDQSELDDFGEFTSIPAPQASSPVESDYQFSIPSDSEQPIASSLSIGVSRTHPQGGVEETCAETAFENRQVDDFNTVTLGNGNVGVGCFEPSDGSKRPTDNNMPSSLIGDSFAWQVESVNQEDAIEFGDFEGVQESRVDNEAVDSEGFAHFLTPVSDTTQNSVDVYVLHKAMPESQPESTVDDDDWGDFEHVQVPTNTEVPSVDDFAAFAEPLSPQENLEGFAKATGPTEFAAFKSVLEPHVDFKIGQGAGNQVVFDADFSDFESYADARETKATNQGPNDFGDWDSFQDATPSVNIRQEPPKSLDEIQIGLQRLSLTGLLANIDISLLLTKNLVSRNWASGFGSTSSSTLQRARRCFELVSLLSSSCSNLLSSDWSRVVTVVRNELTMGLFLLQEAKGLSKEGRKEVKRPLSNMVSGLGEFVRVVRSIIATVGDIFCLDLQTPLSKELFASSWQSLDVVQLALEVEESWKSIENVSRTLGLSIATRLETVQAIRMLASDAESSSLCQLTLQPLSHVESTKNEVIWEGKPFMACSANFWSNRVSNTFP